MELEGLELRTLGTEVEREAQRGLTVVVVTVLVRVLYVTIGDWTCVRVRG